MRNYSKNSHCKAEIPAVSSTLIFMTFTIRTLPIRYGKPMLMQELVIADGISEECILGWDAILKHGFTIDGETNSIYLAKETLDQAHFRVPDISIILQNRHVICRRTVVVVEGRTNGSFPYVSPLDTFMFTPSKKNYQMALEFNIFRRSIRQWKI